MKMYILTTKRGLADIVWWEADIKDFNKRISTYGLFGTEEEAEKYKKYIGKRDDLGVKIFVRKIELYIKK